MKLSDFLSVIDWWETNQTWRLVRRHNRLKCIMESGCLVIFIKRPSWKSATFNLRSLKNLFMEMILKIANSSPRSFAFSVVVKTSWEFKAIKVFARGWNWKITRIIVMVKKSLKKILPSHYKYCEIKATREGKERFVCLISSWKHRVLYPFRTSHINLVLFTLSESSRIF